MQMCTCMQMSMDKSAQLWVYTIDAYACEARDVHADVKNADARVNGGRVMCRCRCRCRCLRVGVGVCITCIGI